MFDYRWAVDKAFAMTLAQFGANSGPVTTPPEESTVIGWFERNLNIAKSIAKKANEGAPQA